MKKFKKGIQSDSFFCIENRALPLYEYIQQLQSSHKNILLLVDDANRIWQIQAILALVIENTDKRRIKLIVTVRDYGLNIILQNLHGIIPFTKTINNFNRSDLEKVIKSNSIGNFNQIAIERILDVANGNPRIAIMAARAIKDTNDLNSISNSYSIYDTFFSDLVSVLEQTGRADLKKTIAIISYFHFVDGNKSLAEDIYNIFKISEDIFWENMHFLYTLEIVDLYEQRLCKITDQTLSAFFFYKLVILESIIDFDILLKSFFIPYYQQRMIEAIIPAARTFDFTLIESTISEPIKKYWEYLYSLKEYEKLFVVADTFWFIIPADVLIFLNSIISHTTIDKSNLVFTGNVSGVTEKIFIMLKKFSWMQEDELKISLQLACKYFLKRNDLAHEFTEYVKSSFGFSRSIAYYSVSKQILLFKTLFVEAEKNPEILRALLYIAPYFLKLHHDNTYSEGMTFTITQFGLLFNDKLRELHGIILDYICKQQSNDLLNFISQYIDQMGYALNVNEVDLKECLLFDSTYIIKAIEDKVDFKIFQGAELTQKYIIFLKEHEIDNDKIALLLKKSSTSIYFVYKLLSSDKYERMMLQKEGLTYDEINEIQKREIKEYTNNLSFQEYEELIEQIKIIKMAHKDNDYETRNGISCVFQNLVQKKELFFRLLKNLLMNKNEIYFDFSNIPWIYFELYPGDINDLYELINSYEYNLKSIWLFSFFSALPQHLIDSNYTKKLIDYFQANYYGTYLSFDFLKKYDKYEKGIFIKVCSILYENREHNKCSFSLLFNPYSEIHKNIKDIFKDDISLLEKLWLHENNKDRTFDYDGKVLKILLESNPDFIFTYLKEKYKNSRYLSEYNDHREYSFIWQLHGYETIMNNIIDYVLSEDQHFLDNSIINVFFSLKKEDQGISEIQKRYITKFITKNSKNLKKINLIFIPIKKMYFSEYPDYIFHFLTINKEIKDFKELKIEYKMYSGNDTFLPVYNKMLKLWEDIQTKLCHIDFLEHRQYIATKINNWKLRINEERKNEFLGRMYI